MPWVRYTQWLFFKVSVLFLLSFATDAINHVYNRYVSTFITTVPNKKTRRVVERFKLT